MFLAFSKVTGIETLHLLTEDELSNPNAPRAPVETPDQMLSVIGLVFGYKTKWYFFSDIQCGYIMSVHLNRTGFETTVENVGSAEGLAYDEFFQEIYWTSYTNSSISRISVNRHRFDPGRKKIIQLGPDYHPRAIVIDSCESKMYWTNWNNDQASIMTLYWWDMKNIITTDIKTPNGLTVDHPTKKLYWSDARLDKMERCNFDGSNRVSLYRATHSTCLDWLSMETSSTGPIGSLVPSFERTSTQPAEIAYLKKNILRQPMGIIAIAEDANNSAGAACLDNGFTCLNEECINYEFTCNGNNDCSDASDEYSSYCKTRSCLTGYFQCNNGRCIDQAKKCNANRTNDCGDFSDEKSCGCQKNQKNEFQFASDRSCILETFRCDHDKDCPDSSDEIGCHKTKKLLPV